jgi:drug/metabolite transporter (DMT)-like permease
MKNSKFPANDATRKIPETAPDTTNVATSGAAPGMSSGSWALLLLLSVLWGGSFFFNDVALSALPPFTLVFLRVAGAAVVLHLVILAQGKRMPSEAKIWMNFIGMGILNNAVPFSLIVWGQTHIASGLAAIFNAATPMMTVLVAHFLTDNEKITQNKIAGVAIGFVGVAVMIGPELFGGLTASASGEIAVVMATVSYAFAAVFGRRFKKMGIAPLQTATGQVTTSAIIMLPLALAVDHPWQLPLPGAHVWLAVAGFVVLSTALAYIVYFKLLESAGATNLALVTFLIPVSAILLGVLFLGETLLLRQVAGMGLIGLGLAAIDGRLLRRLRAASA